MGGRHLLTQAANAADATVDACGIRTTPHVTRHIQPRRRQKQPPRLSPAQHRFPWQQSQVTHTRAHAAGCGVCVVTWRVGPRKPRTQPSGDSHCSDCGHDEPPTGSIRRPVVSVGRDRRHDIGYVTVSQRVPNGYASSSQHARAVPTHSVPHGTGPSTVQPPGTAGAYPSHAGCHCWPRRAPQSNHTPPGGRAERITHGAPGCSGEQHSRIQRGIAAHVGRPTAQASTRQFKPVPKPRDGVERGQERWSHRSTLPWCSVPVGAWLGLSGWCLQHGPPQRRCVRLVAAVAQYWPSGRRRHTRTRGCDRCGEEPAWARRCRTTVGQHNTITGPAAFRGVTQRDGSAFHPDASGHNPPRAGHAVTLHV